MKEGDTPPTNEARLLTAKAAAVYVGASTPTFLKWVAQGLLPAALPIMKRWDKRAIDAAIDRLGGLNVPEDQGYEIRRREREARNRARLDAEAQQAQQQSK